MAAQIQNNPVLKADKHPCLPHTATYSAGDLQQCSSVLQSALKQGHYIP